MKRLGPWLLFLLLGASVYGFWVHPRMHPPEPVEIVYEP